MAAQYRTIKELVQEANNYEYSNTVPIRVYLRTADTLNRHADLFRDGKSYDDAYILYVRFLDLVMNKLPHHPKLKKDPKLYQSYHTLVNDKAPAALKNAEVIKNIISEQLEAHQRYAALLEDTRRRQNEVEKARGRLQGLEQEILDSKSGTATPTEQVYDVDDDTLDSELNGLLRQSATPETHLPSTAYPQVPEHHEVDLQTSSLPPPQLPFKETFSVVTPGPPLLPPKVKDEPSLSSRFARISKSLHIPHKTPEHKTVAHTEGGKPLKTVYLPSELQSRFLSIARSNTQKRLETCGIICGKLSLNAFFITTLVIPEQESTENTCQTNDEEALFQYVDENDLFVLGWIHTHPTQSCFLSSVDLHTQNSYQIMLPEAMAIVCAPTANPSFGVYRLTDPPGIGIVTQCQRGGFHPHEESNLYIRCERKLGGHVATKDGLPFTCVDLRKKH